MEKDINVLIIGAVACGAKTASRIHRLDPLAKITMLDQGKYISYAGCGLPYYISGDVKEFDELLQTGYGRIRDVDYFKDIKGADVRTGMRAESIDREKKIVIARDLSSNTETTFSYDKLVLGMGAAPVRPEIEGIDLKGIYHMTSMEDAAAISDLVKGTPGGSAVIIGAGFIGIECVEALRQREWDVTLIEVGDQVFPKALDFDIAANVEEHLFESMVEVELEAKIRRIEGENGRASKVITENSEYDADLVILATGVRPNVGIARDAGLTIGETGALSVNSKLQTSDPDIYAGGDLVENLHLVSGKKCYMPLGSTANKHGRVIADNICGIDSEFPGVLGTFVCKALKINVGATGLTEKHANDLEIDAYSIAAPGFDKAHYYPDGALMGLKLVIEKGTNRLLGLQAAGPGDVARRIDIAATALKFGATIDQLSNLDLAYAPPFSQALDVIITASNVAKNSINGDAKLLTSKETQELLEKEDIIIVDVRTNTEFHGVHIENPKVKNIPLDDLPQRMDEIPKDKKILCMCMVGQRSYEAQRMLQAAGYPEVYTVAGGVHLWPWKDDLA